MEQAHIINLGGYESIGSHWVALHVNTKSAAYFDSFGVEHIVYRNRKPIGNKNIVTNIYGIEAYYSAMCVYICIDFINFMLKGKSILKYTNLFSPNKYKKNNIIILKYFQWWKSIVMFAINTENLKTLKYHVIFKKY